MNLDKLKDIFIQNGYKKVEVPTYENVQPVQKDAVMNRDDIIEYESLITDQDKENVENFLGTEKYKPCLEAIYKGLGIPKELYKDLQPSLDKDTPLVYFQTHVSS